MPSVRDLPAVRRLNAPTRAAATRRRRLRKGGAAFCAALAVLVLFSPRGSGPPRPGAATTAAEQLRPLRGRHLVSLPVDPVLAAALHDDSRVDVWEPSGRPVARGAPVANPKRAGGRRVDERFGAQTGGHSRVLVALTETETGRIARSAKGIDESQQPFLVTLSP